MTARTPRTTREEREGLFEAAVEAYLGPHDVVRYDPSTVAAVMDDLRDAEAERDAAVERAERAEAAVGRVRAYVGSLTRQSVSYCIESLAVIADDLRAALDPATDAETGRGGAGRGSADD